MNEGFFADVVVLVEGEDDRAAILGMSYAMELNLERDGYCVIPCMGKNNLDRPLVIFRKLGIPVYVIWDSDYKTDNGNPTTNRYLLRLVEAAAEDWPSAVEGNYASFISNMEIVIREEIGELEFDDIITDLQDEFGINKREQALKMPVIIQKAIQRAREVDRTSQTLEAIVNMLLNLKQRQL